MRIVLTPSNTLLPHYRMLRHIENLLPAGAVFAHLRRQFIAQPAQPVCEQAGIIIDVREARTLLFDEGFLLGDGGNGVVAHVLPEGHEQTFDAACARYLR